jgi:hypothetical protein
LSGGFGDSIFVVGDALATVSSSGGAMAGSAEPESDDWAEALNEQAMITSKTMKMY